MGTRLGQCEIRKMYLSFSIYVFCILFVCALVFFVTLSFIFVENLGLFANVCCVFSTSKMKILGALYLLKTSDLVFKNENIGSFIFVKDLGLGFQK